MGSLWLLWGNLVGEKDRTRGAGDMITVRDAGCQAGSESWLHSG